MATFLLLIACLAGGVALRASGRVAEEGHVPLNAVIVNLALPALTLSVLHRAAPTVAHAWAIAMPWLMFALAAGLFMLAGSRFGLSRSTAGALLLTAGLGNTSFLGLPLIETFYGREAMAVGILIDQLGSYLVLATLGIPLAAMLASERADRREIVRRVLTFPPFLAMLAAFALAPVSFPAWLVQALDRLAATVAPLALLSVGMQLRFDAIASEKVPLALGLTFKLLLAPLAIGGFYAFATDVDDPVIRVTLLESAMAPMLGGGIVAMQYRLNPSLVALMLGIGVPLSLLTVPAWWTVIERFA